MFTMLKAPKLLLKRYYYGQRIKKFDAKLDELVDPANCGLEKGFLKLPIDELLGDGMTERLKSSELRVTPQGEKRIYTSWDIPAFLWKAVLTSDKLGQIVRDYLGPNVRLDDLYVKTVSDGLTSVSEGWHTDQVGYRIKVFMVFDAEGDPAGTLIIPADRPNPYKINFTDEFARILRRPNKEDRTAATRVTYEAGDCLVFDTNILHRGDYSSGAGTRYCIVAEFIDRRKADKIVKFAPCGPGQGARNITIPVLDGVDVSQHPLIDSRLLKPAEGVFKYGYKAA
ncbi:MAG: hypothetical protein CSA70_02680 [Rhodobacterales bacterium]|nr:MAG: hypothetical protein CSA70_02680 [Rhodobacterales bacterium]